MLATLGLQNVRAKRLIKMSETYLRDPPSKYDPRPSRVALTAAEKLAHGSKRYPWTPISHLSGAGRYALDSYRIFCPLHQDPTSDEWEFVLPTDKELIRYLKWRWAFIKRLEWDPSAGPKGRASCDYLQRLVTELERQCTTRA